MFCFNCGKEMTYCPEGTYAFSRSDSYLIIEKIPIYHCYACEEEMLGAEDMEKVISVEAFLTKQAEGAGNVLAYARVCSAFEVSLS